jgi:hypothetical protein
LRKIINRLSSAQVAARSSEPPDDTHRFTPDEGSMAPFTASINALACRMSASKAVSIGSLLGVERALAAMPGSPPR